MVSNSHCFGILNKFGNNRRCTRCEENRLDAKQKLAFSSLPPLLIIQLRRFSYEEDGSLKKKRTRIEIPLK